MIIALEGKDRPLIYIYKTLTEADIDLEIGIGNGIDDFDIYDDSGQYYKAVEEKMYSHQYILEPWGNPNLEYLLKIISDGHIENTSIPGLTLELLKEHIHKKNS